MGNILRATYIESIQLFFHDFQHHPGTQPKAVLEDQAIRDGLILPYTIDVLLEQFFLLVCQGSCSTNVTFGLTD